MTISNYDDIIDSRDVIERIEELETILTELHEQSMLEDEVSLSGDEKIQLRSEREELQALKALQEEAEGYASDWHHGATFIRESYFTDYCEELCKDIGSIPADCPDYIRDNINWEGVADDLMVDYTEVEFDGVTYYVR